MSLRREFAADADTGAIVAQRFIHIPADPSVFGNDTRRFTAVPETDLGYVRRMLNSGVFNLTAAAVALGLDHGTLYRIRDKKTNSRPATIAKLKAYFMKAGK